MTEEGIFLDKKSTIFDFDKFLQIKFVALGTDLNSKHDIDKSDINFRLQKHINIQIDKRIPQKDNSNLRQKHTKEIKMIILTLTPRQLQIQLRIVFLYHIAQPSTIMPAFLEQTRQPFHY